MRPSLCLPLGKTRPRTWPPRARTRRRSPQGLPEQLLRHVGVATEDPDLPCFMEGTSAKPRLRLWRVPDAGFSCVYRVKCILSSHHRAFHFRERPGPPIPAPSCSILVSKPGFRRRGTGGNSVCPAAPGASGLNRCNSLGSEHAVPAPSGKDRAFAGQQIWMQGWYREPAFATPNNVGLTAGLSALVCP